MAKATKGLLNMKNENLFLNTTNTVPVCTVCDDIHPGATKVQVVGVGTCVLRTAPIVPVVATAEQGSIHVVTAAGGWQK